MVRGHQQIVVKWMRRQLDRLGWTPERWAREAGLAPTTVTRAMAASFSSVSSVPTLHALARAAGVRSVIDFLGLQADGSPDAPVLAAMLDELLPVVGYLANKERIGLLAGALAQALAGMVEQNDTTDPELARVLARAARANLYRTS